MNIRRVGLLVVAVAAAGAAAFLARTLTHRPAHNMAAHQIVEPSAVEVLVAARALDPGTIVKTADLRWQAWPQASLSPNFMQRQAMPTAIADETGTTVRAHVDLGEPITSNKLIKANSAGFMAAMLTPGTRAVSVKIDDDTAAGGFILPGDRVDVIMTHHADRGGDGNSSDSYESQTILNDVRVLAIGQASEAASGDKVMQGKTATLELAPSEAEMLALADAMGTLTLSLRSAANTDITAAIGPKSGGLKHNRGDTGSIRVVRYSHASRVLPVTTIASGDAQ